MAKEHIFIVKILEHTGKIMNKNQAPNSKIQRLNTVNNLMQVLAAICRYVWESIVFNKLDYSNDVV